MNTASSIIDRLADVLGISRRAIEDVITRLRADPTLMRPAGPGRRPTGTPAFAPAEIVNVVLAIAASPPAGRRGLNACDTVRAARRGERYREWEAGQPEVSADFFSGTTFDREVATLGAALDSIVTDMVAGRWPRRLAARLRFDHAGSKILLAIENWPDRGDRILAEGEVPSLAGLSDIAMIFHARDLLKAWKPSNLETSVFVDKYALPALAAAIGPPMS